MERTILIVEDDAAFGSILKKWFLKNGFTALLCTNISEARNELRKRSIDLILSDLRLPDGDGIMLLQWVREQKMTTPVIVMTSYGEISTAVSAIKLGAEDFMEKPIDHGILKMKIDLALAKKELPVEANSGNFIIGKSRVARQMYDYLLKVAPTRLSILLLGESGTGKEFIARMIHENSPRRERPFIAVDCGSLSKELAPSELFGHLKGSFTSALSDKKGVFEEADGGTVLLDEIGNLPYEVQVQLLRALQEQKVRPVGSSVDIKTDVRIIAATNENLESAIAEGRFREDLFHRLNEFSVTVPPLRMRREDIALFAGEFLKQANKEMEKNILDFTPEAYDILRNREWSGNLRELRNVVRRVVLFASGDYITAGDVPETLSVRHEEEHGLTPENEKEQIEDALKKSRGNKSLAAQMLKIDRKTLYNKMHLYGIRL
jgi:two-component system response regulator HydG